MASVKAISQFTVQAMVDVLLTKHGNVEAALTACDEGRYLAVEALTGNGSWDNIQGVITLYTQVEQVLISQLGRV